MFALLAVLALTPVSYTFAKDAHVGYDVEIGFNGFIPVVGGLDGEANVKLGFDVAGAPPDKEGNPCVACELKAFSLTINGADLPFTLDNVAPYFPKNTLSVTPQGKVLKTDAPNLKLPVRLPGLDVKRMPDLAFLPVEFPVEGIEVGKEWTFKKAFGDADVAYTVKVKTIADDRIDLDLKLAQAYDTLEDEAKNVVASDKDAVAKVHTEMTGTGNVAFDAKLGIVRASSIEVTSTSHVVDIQTKAATDRKLKMTVRSRLREKNAPQWKKPKA